MLIMIDNKTIVNIDNIIAISIEERGKNYAVRYNFNTDEYIDGQLHRSFQNAQNELKHILHCYENGEKILIL